MTNFVQMLMNFLFVHIFFLPTKAWNFEYFPWSYFFVIVYASSRRLRNKQKILSQNRIRISARLATCKSRVSGALGGLNNQKLSPEHVLCNKTTNLCAIQLFLSYDRRKCRYATIAIKIWFICIWRRLMTDDRSQIWFVVTILIVMISVVMKQT